MYLFIPFEQSYLDFYRIWPISILIVEVLFFVFHVFFSVNLPKRSSLEFSFINQLPLVSGVFLVASCFILIVNPSWSSSLLQFSWSIDLFLFNFINQSVAESLVTDLRRRMPRIPVKPLVLLVPKSDRADKVDQILPTLIAVSPGGPSLGLSAAEVKADPHLADPLQLSIAESGGPAFGESSGISLGMSMG